MKRLTPFLLLLILACLAGCHPSAPKPASPATTPPKEEQPVAPSTATVSTDLSIAPSTETASATLTKSPEVAPPSLLGPTSTSSATLTAPDVTTSSTPVVVAPPQPTKITTLRVLAPAGQISDGVKQELATKLGLDVQIDTYTSHDEAFQKLGTATASYQIALVSYRIVPQLISGQKLAALPTLVPTQQPAPKYLHHFFDRDNKYALPYAFSLAGIAVRAADVKTPLSQWSHLFSEANWKQAQLPADEGLMTSLLAKAGMRNSSLTAPAPKDETPAPIQVDSIANLKKRYATQTGWRFVLPGEGSVIFMYCAVVPANSPSPERSAAILNEFFNPEVTARIAEENYLGVTQPAAFKLLQAASTGDSLVYPPDRIQNACVFIRSGFRPIPTP